MKPSEKGLEYWVERVSDQEMPALAAIVRKLEQIVSDDISSLGQLGQVVLHDNALTTKILRVANSASYNAGRPSITTISRAAVLLGAKSIRNICLTAKLLENLLEQNNLSQALYQRVLQVMANSFHAAMQARTMLARHDDDTQEEVFIAALLLHLGESAFWSLGGDEIEQLNKAVSQSSADKKAIIHEFLGTDFSKLSCGLARSWQLGDLLVKSLEKPDLRTPEINSIILANRMADTVASKGWEHEDFRAFLPRIAEIMQVGVEEAEERIKACAEATGELASHYGARELRDYLPLAPGAEDEAPGAARTEIKPNEGLQLKVLRELTAMMSETIDINLVIHTALEGIHRGIGMDRTVAALLTLDRKTIKARFMLGEGNETWGRDFNFSLAGDDAEFFNAILKISGAKKIDAAEMQGSSPPEALAAFCSYRGCVLAPIKVADKAIGIIYADRSFSGQNIEADDFSAFNHFVQQANLCLSVLRNR